MNILIFRTNIKTKKKVKAVKPLFNNHPVITAWSIDIEDIDNVLRIEAQEQVSMACVDYVCVRRVRGCSCVCVCV